MARRGVSRIGGRAGAGRVIISLMPLSPWLTFRHAKDAIRNGRPEEAHRLLSPLATEGYRKAGRLLRDVAATYVARGEKAHRADNPEAAWKDLLAAEALNTGDARVGTLRSALTRIGVAECAAALEAGRPMHVLTVVGRLKERHVQRPDLEAMEILAQDWVMSIEMADRGDFLLAQSTIDRLRVRMVMAPTTGLDAFAKQLGDRHERFRTAIAQLSEAAESHKWADAAKWAGEAIAVAPNHREARTIQLRAWESLKPNTGSYRPNGVEMVTLAAAGFDDAPTRSQGSPNGYPSARGSGHSGMPKRFLLWIDGVGGYLVCLSNRVTFGQATADAPIDVPLFADVSRMHAELARDGEGYVVESTRGLHVNGSPNERSLLKCGDRVTLGTSCQFLFRQPVSISPSARLELVSGHRLPLAVDGVLLMADKLILGPGSQTHIVLGSPTIGHQDPRRHDLRYHAAQLIGRSPTEYQVLPFVVGRQPAQLAAQELAIHLRRVGEAEIRIDPSGLLEPLGT